MRQPTCSKLWHVDRWPRLRSLRLGFYHGQVAMQDEWDEKTVVSMEVAAAGPSGRTRARLIVLAGGNVGEMYEIDPQLVLGRGREADVRLQGDGISRKHARV